MTLEELQKEKKELEKQIEKLVNDFTAKWDVTVSANISQEIYCSMGLNETHRETNAKIVIEL